MTLSFQFLRPCASKRRLPHRMGVRKRSAKAFTLIELVVSVSLAVMFLGASTVAFLYLLKSESIATAQASLDIDVRRAAERIKTQMRLSALNQMVFFPAAGPRHIAVSFPLPGDIDGDGAIDTDADGKVLWRSTIIYHPYPPPPAEAAELRVTTFEPRIEMSDANRLVQIQQVTNEGDGANAPNSANASTEVIFRNLFDWNIRPLAAIYDSYAELPRRNRNVALGSVIIEPGAHTATFTSIDPHPDSTGHVARVDTLLLTPSYLPLEAENLTINNHGHPSASPSDFDGMLSGGLQLVFPFTATEQSNTVSFVNDSWQKASFRELGDLHRDVDVVPDPTTGYAVQLAGMHDRWDAASQTGDAVGTPSTNPEYLSANAVRIVLQGHQMPHPGFSNVPAAGCRVRFAAGDSSLRIRRAWISEAADATTPSPDVTGPMIPLTFNDGALNISVGANSQMETDVAIMRDADNNPVPIDPNKAYIVTFLAGHHVVGHQACPHVWTATQPTNAPSAYRLPNITTESDPWLTAADTWNSHTNLIVSPNIYGVASLFGTYAPTGVFESRIADTQLDAPEFEELIWQAIEDPYVVDTSVSLKIRSGHQPDLSDATAWSNLNAVAYNDLTLHDGLDAARYVQVRAELTPNIDAGGTATPMLQGVQLFWPGETRIVDIGGTFSQGPDGGRFELRIDGHPLKTGVIVDLELYRNIRGFKMEGHQRLRSAVVSEISPRNTDWQPD